MSEFFARLAQRAMGGAHGIMPIIPNRFETAPAASPLPEGSREDHEAIADTPARLAISAPVARDRSSRTAATAGPRARAASSSSAIGGEPDALPTVPRVDGEREHGAEAPAGRGAPRDDDPPPSRVRLVDDPTTRVRLADDPPPSRPVDDRSAGPRPRSSSLAGLREPLDRSDDTTGDDLDAVPSPTRSDAVRSPAAPQRRLTTAPQRQQTALDEPVAPTIHVHIGRVEVRAASPAAAPTRPAAAPRKPEVSLEEYLRRRKDGRG